MSSQTSVTDTINKAWEAADESREAATQYASDAITAANAYQWGQSEVDLQVQQPDDAASLIQTIRNNTNNIVAEDVTQAYNNLFGDLLSSTDGSTILSDGSNFDATDSMSLLSTLSQGFNDSFLFGSPEAGLGGMLSEMATFLGDGVIRDGVRKAQYGLPDDVEQQIQDKMTDQLNVETVRQENDVLSMAASRGFPVPPGALQARVEEMRDKSNASKAEAIGKLAIDKAKRGFEAHFKNIDLLRDVQKQAATSFMDYLNAAIQARSGASDDMVTLVQTIVGLQNSVTSIYGHLETQRATYLREVIAEEELGIGHDKVALDRFQASVETKVQAAISAAQAMGAMASSALGSQNTMATIAHKTLAQE